MLQRPKFNPYSAQPHPFPDIEEHDFNKYNHFRHYSKSSDLKGVAASITSSTETLKKDQGEGSLTLNRKTSKIRRFSAMLNKKLHRKRLSQEQISPPVLITSSSFIQTNPIQKPAKELVNQEKPPSTHLYHTNSLSRSYSTRLSGPLSRHSSKSSTRTQQSERETTHLDSRNAIRHRGFLSGGSLSSFTSSGSSDKHSSIGTYNRERHQSSTYTSLSVNDWEEITDSHAQLPDPIGDFSLAKDHQNSTLPAEQTRSDTEFEFSSFSPAMTKWEEAALAQRELPSTDQFTMMRNTSSSNRISSSCCFSESIKWTDIKSGERAMSDYGPYFHGDINLPYGNIRHPTATNSIKSRRREAIVYAKESEDYQQVLFGLEAPEKCTSAYPEEASILEFLSILTQSNSTGAVHPNNKVPVRSGSFSAIPEVDEEPYSMEVECVSPEDEDLCHHSIFDLYDYESADDEEVEEVQAQTQPKAMKMITLNDQGSGTSHTSLTELIDKLNRISMTIR